MVSTKYVLIFLLSHLFIFYETTEEMSTYVDWHSTGLTEARREALRRHRL